LAEKRRSADVHVHRHAQRDLWVEALRAASADLQSGDTDIMGAVKVCSAACPALSHSRAQGSNTPPTPTRPDRSPSDSVRARAALRARMAGTNGARCGPAQKDGRGVRKGTMLFFARDQQQASMVHVLLTHVC
jgi:hypothetical protein